MSSGPAPAGLARRRRRRRLRRLHRAGRGGRGRARRDPPPAGDPGRRPRRPVELQGRQVRVVQRGDQRPAAADVHDPAVDLRARRDDHGQPDADLPGDPRPRHRRVASTSRRPARSRRSRRRRTTRAASSGWQQVDVERSQEFRKCIECFLCQNTCHVIRDHEENKPASPARGSSSGTPSSTCTRSTPRTARTLAQEDEGLGYCNITKCCTEVCPENIKITDNAIIPMKERVVDTKYDPVLFLGSKIGRRKDRRTPVGPAGGRRARARSSTRSRLAGTETYVAPATTRPREPHFTARPPSRRRRRRWRRRGRLPRLGAAAATQRAERPAGPASCSQLARSLARAAGEVLRDRPG